MDSITTLEVILAHLHTQIKADIEHAEWVKDLEARLSVGTTTTLAEMLQLRPLP